MSTYVIRDSTAMLRRNIKKAIRYPSLTLMVIGMPIIFLVLFVYVFGSTLGDGLGGTSGGRDAYLTYVTPGILLFGILGSVQGTAITVSMDKTEGIMDRFRTMAISRSSVLTGHVIGSLIQTVLGTAVVMAVAVALGFRSDATPLEWLGVLGVMVMVSFAFIWMSVLVGLIAKTVESASNIPMPLMMLPFLGSGFVPTDTMPAGLRTFAEYQPFTPVNETLRGLLLGTEIGDSAWLAVAWCAGISLVCFLLARRRFNRPQTR
ncbi:ABC transporter permease [Stackebrandtia nassauensis]|uniref:Transport permease protein n=1 Tax=Stackebrandtia nassauensis (strain DSM 44728 / CIP 108903 / NRRL B-16338 / NBRC 102104 / LLR-40K-21) TaxID=446470 RepID=D3PWZ4_STANL|nr:ABC transporter permease [Stackebrandtia nassauensis]ADD45218.1 ABC-2 type transporter [Stackebrandtia nassauensis DSM 44728]